MTSIGAALAPHHHIRLLGEHVDDLSLPSSPHWAPTRIVLAIKQKPRQAGQHVGFAAGGWEATRLSIKSLPATPADGYVVRMPLPADYHAHATCRHAKGEPTEYAARAIEVGFEIGLSDHSPMREDDFDDWRMRASELTEYASKVDQARLDHPTLPIRFEVDFLHGQEPWIREMADLHDWDYFIGSVHYLGDWAIDELATLNQWRDRDTMEVWTAYFKNLTDAAATDLLNHRTRIYPRSLALCPRAIVFRYIEIS